VLFRISSMVLGFVNTWLITNYFGDAVYGRFAVALTILQLTAMVFALGTPTAFVSFSGKFDDDSQRKGLFNKISIIVFFSTLIPAILFFFGAEFISLQLFNKQKLTPYIIILGLGVVLVTLHGVMCNYFVATKKFITHGLLLFLIPNILFFILLITVSQLNYPPFFTFLAYTASFSLTSIVGFLVIYFNKHKPGKTQLSTKAILKSSTPMMISGLFLVLLSWTDTLMLGFFEPESEIGIYNVAIKVGYLTLFIVASMNVIIMPKVSELFHLQDFKAMKTIVNKTTQTIILLTIPVALFIIFLSKTILSFFGDSFTSGSLALIIITTGTLINAAMGNGDQILNMTNNQNIVKNIFIAGFIINVTFNLVLIPLFGINGAAAASLVTNVFINILIVLVIKKRLGFYTMF